MLFKNKNKDSSSKKNKIDENCVENEKVNDCGAIKNSRDVTTGTVDCEGARLVNEYWGVTLEVPKNAVPEGTRQEVYFVITDPRLCENAPPLDLENGIKFFI